MSDEHRNKIENSKNISSGSQYSAGKNIRIGDSNVNIILKFNRVLLLAIIIGLAAGVYLTYEEKEQKAKPMEVPTLKNSIPVEKPIEKKEALSESLDSRKPKAKVSENSKPQKAKALEVSFSNPNKYATQEIFLSCISEKLDNKNIYLRTVPYNQQRSQKGLQCKIIIDQENQDIGTHPGIRITFRLEAILYGLDVSLTPKSYTLYSEQEIPNKFREWLEQSDVQILPEKIITNTIL